MERQNAINFNNSNLVESSDEMEDNDQEDTQAYDESPDLIFLPFQAIKEYPAILSPNTVFKPNEPIEVRVINVERSTYPRFHPHIYEIDIRHAGYHWIISRRYQRIHNLHRRLRLYALSLRLSRKAHLQTTSSLKPQLPAIPRQFEIFVTPEQLETRRVKLEKFFQDLLSVSLWREHPETLRFLEVSSLSFMGELGEKGKEMPLKKLSNRIRIPIVCSKTNVFCDGLSSWKERWILVKDTYYAYLSTKSNRVANVLLIDRDMRIEHDPRYSQRYKSIVISNSTRDLVLKFRYQREFDDWIKYFEYVISGSAAQFVKPHPHGSSYPVRDDAPCKWFIDGASYMSAVADMLELAQEEIYITDWWFSPEIFMKRPITEGERWRLDRILQRRAEAGVKIYVLLYKEVPIALGINSFYSKSVLTKRHPNIKVQRHPDHIGGNIWFWSHHEKTVIIDQKIAFLGGIDLCYGRWDDHLYRVTDTGPISADKPASATEATKVERTCKDSVARCSPKEDAPPEEVELMKSEQHRDIRAAEEIKSGRWRMGQPFKKTNAHDARDTGQRTGGLAGIAAAAMNKVKNTNQLKTRHEVERSQSVPAETPRKIFEIVHETVETEGRLADSSKPRFGDDSMLLSAAYRQQTMKTNSPKFRRHTRLVQNAIRLGRSISHKESAQIFDEVDSAPAEVDLDRLNIKASGRLWLGKDYSNEVRKAFGSEAMEKPFDDEIDRMEVPRMPWHDIGAVVFEHAARDVARHFIQRWNACKVEKNRRDEQYTFLVPKSYDSCDVADSKILAGTHNCRVQLLRSVSSWSAGLRPNQVEDSIHQAYISCIQVAKHFIYIENQFFITLAGDRNTGVSNGIGEALFQRIQRAHLYNEKFRVYVVMPLKPGIEGEYGTNRGAAVQAITHWNYQSICRGGNSLYERIRKLGADPTKYLSFCGMRTYGEINGKLVSELVYVHSKMMIVDDLYAIIGSANINDRSMLGTRDSEIAILVKDREFDESTMDGKPFQSGKFAGRLRRRLMKICLGIWNDPDANNKVADVVSDEFFDEWNGVARSNEQIYEEVFACLPCDSVLDFVKLTEWSQMLPKCVPDDARQVLKKVKGYLCKLSLDFLKDQNLSPAFSSKENVSLELPPIYFE